MTHARYAAGPDRSRRLSRVARVALVGWAIAVAIGFVRLADYATQDAAGAQQLYLWPTEASIERSDRRIHLLAFLHPRCVCSQATVQNLASLPSRNRQHRLTVVFYCPSNQPVDWAKTGLWDSCGQLADTTRMIDRDGVEARRFGVRVSGHVLAFDQQKTCLYSGGITSARGHSGPNRGLLSLRQLIAGKQPDRSRFPIFGCGVVNRVTSEAKPNE